MTSASNLHQLNLALTRGAEKETFVFPKGPSGKVKLAPKRPKASTDSKEVYNPPHPSRNVLFNLSQNTKPPSKKAPSAKKAETTKAVPAKKAAAAKTKIPAEKSSGTKKSAAAAKKAPTATKKAATVKKPSIKKTTSAKSDAKKVSLSL